MLSFAFDFDFHFVSNFRKVISHFRKFFWGLLLGTPHLKILYSPIWNMLVCFSILQEHVCAFSVIPGAAGVTAPRLRSRNLPASPG